MSNTFKKTGLRGFTLIELLVVIAIIGLLSTVIAAPITQARKKGRDGKKVADMHQVQGALQQYADDNTGNYPLAFDALIPKYIANMPPNAATTTPRKDKYMYVVYDNSDNIKVGFHLGAKLEAPGLALGDDRDCVGTGDVTTTTGKHACVDDSETIMSATPPWTVIATNSVTGSIVGKVGFADDMFSMIAPFTAVNDANDFGGGEDTASTSCTALTNSVSGDTSAKTCIYDITN